jgi:tetratricopeptide (TPR) repeat protein
MLAAGIAAPAAAAGRPARAPRRAACVVETALPAAAFKGTANLRRWEAQARRKSKDALDQLEAGVAAYENGDGKLAVSYYGRALSLNHHYGEAAADLGNAYLRLLHDPARARTYYEEATRIQPGYLYGWYDLAWEWAVTEKNPKEAAAVARRALAALSPCDGQAVYQALRQMAKG